MEDNQIPDYLRSYREELVTLLHKSQDTFEKQLSYISAGSLALSIGFIKDIVQNIEFARWKWLLALGWVLLGVTLLINCISHIRAADLHNTTIKDIDDGKYDQNKVLRRHKEINRTNWITASLLIAGIFLIVFFVIINLLTMSKTNQPSNPKPGDSGNKGYVPSSPPPPQKDSSKHSFQPSSPPPNPKPAPPSKPNN